MYKPDVLTGVGIAGVFLTAYLSAKAAIKYQKETEGRDLSATDKFKVGAKCFSGAAVVATGTAVAIYQSNDLSKTYLIEAVGMYEIATKRLHNQTESIKETVSEDIQKEIQEKTDKKNVSIPRVFIEDTGTGNNVFHDSIMDRYFRMSKEQFLLGIYEFNRTFHLRGAVNMNYLYRLWGAKESTFGKEIGWNEYYMSVEWDANWIDIDCRKVETESGDVIYEIIYPMDPKWDYEDY